jgi:hypothetical protein
VPDKLKAGANESLVMIVPAKGVQIYDCRARKDPGAGYEWAFVAPEADLLLAASWREVRRRARIVQQSHEHPAREYRGRLP